MLAGCAVSHGLILWLSRYGCCLRFQARVDRMEDFQNKGEEINKSLTECRRKLAETQKKLQELSVATSDGAKAELSKVQAEEKKFKKEERELAKKMEEHNREEKKMPWNVDTLSRDGFSKVTQIKQSDVISCCRSLERDVTVLSNYWILWEELNLKILFLGMLIYIVIVLFWQ